MKLKDEVEAWQYHGGPLPQDAPDWVVKATTPVVVKVGIHHPMVAGLTLETKEGSIRVAPEDWIIRDPKGEIYSCRPDIFSMARGRF